MREIAVTEEREGIPAICCCPSDSLCLGFRVIVYKRQDGDRFGCDLRQGLVMPLDEFFRHNRKHPRRLEAKASGNRMEEAGSGIYVAGDTWLKGSAEPVGAAPLSWRQDVVELREAALLFGG